MLIHLFLHRHESVLLYVERTLTETADLRMTWLSLEHVTMLVLWLLQANKFWFLERPRNLVFFLVVVELTIFF